MILLDPTYPAYYTLDPGLRRRPQAPAADGGHRLPLRPSSSWSRWSASKTKLFYLNTPQNPTGGILTRDDLDYIADLARKHNFYVLSDEIYNRFVYEGEHASMITVPDFLDHLVLLDGHSKTYAMTGWRLGWPAPTCRWPSA